MGVKDHSLPAEGPLEAAPLARARYAIRWRSRARFPVERLLECLVGMRVSGPAFEATRRAIEAHRGGLARAGFHPDAPDLSIQLEQRRRPDLRPMANAIVEELRALVAQAKPLDLWRYADTNYPESQGE